VHAFWNREACGAHFIAAQFSEEETFRAYRNFRYFAEWHLLNLVPFSSTKGQRVLEIGTGMGADGLLFAQAGAAYTGLDLTETAIETTRRHFTCYGVPGDFRVGNAENLPFEDASFDFVYSHGVLHHTTHPERAFSEVHRVLKPGGRAVVMLYHQQSFNYYVRIMLYMRLKLLLKILSNQLRGRGENTDPERNAIRGNQHTGLWDRHYANFRETGWSYLAAKNFVHRASDGPDCPFAYVFTRSSAEKAFSHFAPVTTKVAHFPLRKYPSLRWIPTWIERTLASTLGWYLFVFAQKPPQPAK
jgi:SAM-dependent methyltransferase